MILFGLLSKKNLLFLIEVQEEQYDENYLVGGYLNQTIEKVYNGIQYDNQKKIYFDDSKINDSKAFLFTFKDHIAQKFEIKEEESSTAFTVFPSSHDNLFSFGCYDLSVTHSNSQLTCVCCHDTEKLTFNYNSFRNELFHHSESNDDEYQTVSIKRITIIQMN